VAKTEIKKNDLSPDWQPLKMRFFFEKKQILRFEIKDSDKDKSNEMGYIETTMGKIMGAPK
jgi:C2 domain